MSQYLHESVVRDLRETAANLVTEDSEPVDNSFSAKQQRLLVESLYNSWQPTDEKTAKPRKFYADCNVGVFQSVHKPPIVPDVFLSMDAEFQTNWQLKDHRAYFVWEFDKVPEVAIEIVSNTKGGEVSEKKNRYAEIGIPFYVVFDPFLALSAEKLRVFEFGFGKRYRQREDFNLPDIGLSLTVWHGEYENWTDEWLRWSDSAGNLILNGKEARTKEFELRRLLENKLEDEIEARQNLAAEFEKLRAEFEKFKENK